MERLTYVKCPHRWDMGRHPTVYTSRHTFQEVVDRLAAYEDTGLTTEEIEKAMGDCADTVAENQWSIRLLEELGNIDHIKEILQAEQDGRLVVLPCKVWDTVWFIRPHENEAVETVVEKMVAKGNGLYMKLSCNKMYETSCNSIGKTVFLTREEAEAALEGGAE